MDGFFSCTARRFGDSACLEFESSIPSIKSFVHAAKKIFLFNSKQTIHLGQDCLRLLGLALCYVLLEQQQQQNYRTKAMYVRVELIIHHFEVIFEEEISVASCFGLKWLLEGLISE